MFSQLQLPYLIEATIISAIGYIVYQLFFAKDKSFIRNRIYLLCLLFITFVLPMVSLPVFAVENVRMLFQTKTQTTLVAVPDVAEASFHWSYYMWIVYFTIAAFLFVRLLFHIISLLREIKVCDKVRINKLQFVISKKLTTPASLFNMIIVNDVNIPQPIIDHEKVHMQHGHTWDILFLELAKIVLWFNPFIYLISKSFKENHEFIADDIASRFQNSSLDYSKLLLKYAKSIKSPILLNTFSTITKKRILMLTKKTSTNLWKSLLIIPFLFGLISIFAFDTYEVHTGNRNNSFFMDTIPETRLDTIIEFDPSTGEESMTIEKVYINDIKTWIDTTVVFNLETKEEKIQVVKLEAPRTEIILETYTVNEYNADTGDLEINTYHRFPQELVEVTDSIVTFDYDTLEETLEVVKSMAPRRKLISTKTPKK